MRLIFGALIWLTLFAVTWLTIGSNTDETSNSNSQLTTFLTQPRQCFEVEFELPSVVRIGDPIIVMDQQSAQVVGSVTAVSEQQTDRPVVTQWAKVQFYSSQTPIAQGDYLSYHQTPASMDWVVQMMLPPHKRKEISDLIVDAYRENYTEIADALQPILIKSIKEVADVVRNEFYQSIQNREQQITQLGARYQIELVDQELVPLVKDEIWPIVQQETKPLAVEIGEEMFRHASVWRFGWRFIYDRSPLPERNLVQKEFQRFMDKHGLPVIESRVPEFLEIQQRVLKRVSENDKVKQVVSETSMRILRDPEFQKLTTDVMRDVFVDNNKLKEVFAKNWESAEARQALAVTNQKLEPTVTRIGQSLFGSPQQSITPEFSRILRNRILHKDERWLVLHREKDQNPALPDDSKINVKPGTTGTENPFHVPARTRF